MWRVGFAVKVPYKEPERSLRYISIVCDTWAPLSPPTSHLHLRPPGELLRDLPGADPGPAGRLGGEAIGSAGPRAPHPGTARGRPHSGGGRWMAADEGEGAAGM